MRDRILELQESARALEPDAARRGVIDERVLGYAREFLATLPGAPGYVPGERNGGGLDAGFGESAEEIGSLLELLASDVDTSGINPASAGHLGYIPGGGLYYAALGDYLADVTNRYAGVAFASPGAVRLERSLLRWMADLVGYPEAFGGDLCSGGSIANLIGVVTARDAAGLDSGDRTRAPIYLTNQAHHSVDKALRIAGLAECPVRRIAVDSRYRMDAGDLEQHLRRDAASGLRPWLVVASAGTTDVGAIDPLADVAELAHAHGAWMHVDAAYGGFYLLSETVRASLGGLEASDSLVMDPHKGLFLPYGSGAVLVRDRTLQQRAHYYTANYMQDATGPEPSPADLSPELSRPFRGLRLWLPLKLAGLAAFRAALEEKIWLARYFYEELGRLPRFELGPEPELSVVTYRYVPARGDADEFNRRLIAALHADGRVFVSSTVLDGRFVLRLAVQSFRTHLDTVETYLDMLRTAVERLECDT